MPLCFSGGERDDGFLRKNNSGIPGIHPDSERSDRKRKNVKSVIKYSLQGTTQGNGLTGADMPVRFSM